MLRRRIATLYDCLIFFFQAEDGIRDLTVTGVQTCALPISILAAGVVPASYVPEASVGRTDLEEFTGADPVEDPELRVHARGGAGPLPPPAVGFFDGIGQWRGGGDAGGTPPLRAYLAPATPPPGAGPRPPPIAPDTH